MNFFYMNNKTENKNFPLKINFPFFGMSNEDIDDQKNKTKYGFE